MSLDLNSLVNKWVFPWSLGTTILGNPHIASRKIGLMRSRHVKKATTGSRVIAHKSAHLFFVGVNR